MTLRFTTIITLLGLALGATAQTVLEEIIATPEKAGGVYYAYPISGPVAVTPAPEGYTPFYISHYGRHGSRYLISDNDYRWVLDKMQQASDSGALTPLGQDVLQRLALVWQEAEGRGGELSPLGVRQHHAIAQRMYEAYPEVFQDQPEITAASTVVMRCAHSMFSFIESLKEQDPSLVIPRESSQRNMYYLNYHTPESAKMNAKDQPWYQEYNKFKQENTHPDRLMSTLFADSLFVRRFVNPSDLMWGLYWIAIGQQNIETPVTFLELFTPEELHGLWQTFNLDFYLTDAGYPLAQGEHLASAKNLLRNIVETADEYVGQGRHGATLRFGHDGNITPLAALMRLDGCTASVTNPYEVGDQWRTHFFSPMAANLQLVFFRNDAGDVLVKILLNEQETHIPVATQQYPFYRWEDARAYFQRILDTPAAHLSQDY